MDEQTGGHAGTFPDSVREAVAKQYDVVHNAINAQQWGDAVHAATAILHLLEPYPLTPAVPAPVWLEKAWSLHALGMAAKSRGDLRSAASYLQQAAAVLPRRWWPSPTAAALEQLGLVLRELGRLEDAAQQLRRAISLYGSDEQHSAKLWLYLGQVYEQSGRRGDAIRAYHRALQLPRIQPLGEAPEWLHHAYAGVVRCSLRTADASSPFWNPWLGSGAASRAVFVSLCLGGLLLFAWAALAACAEHYTSAAWSLALAGVVLLVLLLPVLRRVSGPGFAFEVRDHREIGFAFPMPAPDQQEIAG